MVLKRFLVVRPDALGDVILVTPLLRSLKLNFPGCHVSVLVRSYTQEILQGHSAVDAVILDWRSEKKIRGIYGFFRYANWLNSQQFDVVILAYCEPYYALLAWMAKIPVRVGDQNKVLLRPFLTHSVAQNFRNPLYHEVDHNQTLLHPLRPHPKKERTLEVPTFSDRWPFVQSLLYKNGWQDTPYIVIHPSTGSNRTWPAWAYAQLIAKIQTQLAYTVVLTGTQADLAIGDVIFKACQQSPISLIGKLSLPELTTLLHHAVAIVATETGPMHLAAALKRPILCISPSKFIKPFRWGPWQTAHRIVRNPHECPLICRFQTCRETFCLDAISTDAVFHELNQLLNSPTHTQIDVVHYWFKKAASILVSLDHQRDCQKAFQLWQKLSELGLVCYFHTNLHQIKERLITMGVPSVKVYQHSLFRIATIVQKMCQLDNTVIHTFSRSWLTLFYWKLVRQLAAQWMAFPPIIVTQPPPENVSDILPFYISQIGRNT